MHFNNEELAITAMAPPHEFSKEGILYTKPLKKSQRKSKSIKANNDGYVERWFCLRGNLLFSMKGIDRSSGVSGLTILERCSVELDAEESGDLFSFVIGQAGCDELIYLGCTTESDRDEWIACLHTASYECMKMQLESLREQITLKTGRDPITSPHSFPVIDSTLVSENEAPYIEMCLSCSKLKGSNNRPPNSMIDILSQVPPNIDWQMIGQTEIVEKSYNPLFMKTIGLGDYQMPAKTRVKLLVCDVRELVSRTRTQIGQATFILEDLLAIKKQTLNIISPDRSQVGAVNVMSWSAPSPSDSSTAAGVQADLALSWHGDKTYRTKKKDQLKFLFCNTVCKVFRFPTVNNHELSVCEMMAESRLTFTLPVVLMKFLLQENNQWKDRINQLDNIETRSDKQKQAIVRSLADFSDYLTSSIHHLEAKHSRQTFKASQLKGERSLETVPLNLHVNRMLARNEYTQSGASHDTITVGAFTAHPRGFKHGGLARLLRSHSAMDSHQTRQPNLSRLSQLMAAAMELCSLRGSVVGLCEDLYRACLAQDGASVKTSTAELTRKSKELLEFCGKKPLVTESMVNFHSSVMQPASNNKSNRRSSPALQSSSRFSPVSQSKRRSPPRAIPSHDLWTGTLSAARTAISDILASAKKCEEEKDSSLWLQMISSDKMKCDAFIEKLFSLTSVGLTHSTIERMTVSDPFSTNTDLMIRYTAVQCQAIATVITGVLAKVRFGITDERFLIQLADIGCLLHFESLLSCHGSEAGMLEDFWVGVQLLEDIDLRFTESLSAKDDYMENPPVITGNRLNFCITMAIPSVAFRLLPDRLQNGGTFKVVPLLFNVGFNEIATIAESVGSTALQERINKASYEMLAEYYREYQRLFGTLDSTLNSRYSVEELLLKLEQNINDSKKKNMEILHLSEEICRKLTCVRFTSCKSAKDRTAMSVTLEECRILQQEHQLSPHMFEKALSCLRSEGVRRQNTFKNIGLMSYSFSSFQLLSFPKLYKPPTGTYGKGES